MTATHVTIKNVQDGLLNGGEWSGNITYSIPGAGAHWQAGYGDSEPTDAKYGILDATQGANFEKVMEIWDSYISPSITKVSDTKPGEIRIAFTDVAGKQGSGVDGYAYYPPSKGFSADPVNGDIWIDATKYKSDPLNQGTFGFELMLHESGHALGLKHPFEDPKLDPAYDSTTYTLMSYTAQDNFFHWTFGGGSIQDSYEQTPDFTPMVLDIMAIQNLYGADKTTAAGNTTYKFTDSSLDGRQAIYDAGGTDTIDLSKLSRGSTLDLRPGAYSNIDYYSIDAQAKDLAAKAGGFEDFIRSQMTTNHAFTWSNDVGIAFSTTIENAVGSGKADTIIGNNAKNNIKGGGGADQLNGGHGNDTLTGNGGADTFIFAKGGDSDTIKDFVGKGTGHDFLDLSGFKTISDYTELKQHMSQDSDGVTIDAGHGDSVLLAGLTMKQLQQADFHF